MRKIEYFPSPTFELVHADNTFVRAVLGCVGSGKSVGCIMDIVQRAMAQKPNSAGVRKSRWALIRATYPMLKTTTIKTFQDWIPHEICPITFGSPIKGFMNISLPDNTVLEAEFIFLALDKADSVEKLKSLELTGAFMNEAAELNPRILEVLKGRVGRYPAAKDGGWSWKGILMDTNPPSQSSWFYKLFEEQRPEGHRIYKQPPPLFYDQLKQTYLPNPDAENVNGHVPVGGSYIDGYRYWLDQIPGNSPDIIKTLILGQYGAVYEGRAVYTSFSDYYHTSAGRIHGDRSRELVVGFDFGLFPAAVFTQTDKIGTLQVLDEEVGNDVTLDEFMEKQVIPKLRGRFRGYDVVFVVDPSGGQRSARVRQSSISALKERGLRVKAAYSNAIPVRLKAVEHFLNRRSKFLISTVDCPVLYQGFNGGYRYGKDKKTYELDKQAKPVKNEYSHPHDGLQYAAMYHHRDFVRQSRTKYDNKQSSRDGFYYA